MVIWGECTRIFIWGCIKGLGLLLKKEALTLKTSKTTGLEVDSNSVIVNDKITLLRVILNSVRWAINYILSIASTK